jgi:hypothetical protein
MTAAAGAAWLGLPAPNTSSLCVPASRYASVETERQTVSRETGQAPPGHGPPPVSLPYSDPGATPRGLTSMRTTLPTSEGESPGSPIEMPVLVLI